MKPTLLLEVAAVEPLAPSIKGFTLLNSTGGELPAFSPGSHLVLELPVGERPLRKAYSLTSSPFDRGAYRIAVRLEPHSKGGSRFMHESVAPGMRLEAHTPSNYMHVAQRARRRLFVAGGIGITPFLSFVAMRDWFPGENQLHYAYRSRDDAAFLPELEADLGGRLRGYDSSAGQRLNVRSCSTNSPSVHTFMFAGQPVCSTTVSRPLVTWAGQRV
jgi:ferredoxin-NADP reductase